MGAVDCYGEKLIPRNALMLYLWGVDHSPRMSSSATASNIKTGIVHSNIEKSVVLMNDPAHGCHRRTSNIVPTDIHRLSMVHCTHRYPWTVHGTLYPQISMDCPWYIVPTDIHGLSMVHCIHRYPWTVHGNYAQTDGWFLQ